MKNKAINTLKYTGIVTLSQYIGSKKVKIAQVQNTGGNPLFDFLSSCLIGDFTLAKVTRPTKIRLIRRSKDASSDTYSYKDAASFGFINLFTKPEKVYSGTKSVVRYSFSISRDQLDLIDNFEELGIGLYHSGAQDTEIANYSAFCEINLTKGSLVNSSLVVDWELAISNA